jgi:SAM-dependent methyltransferase
MLTDACPACRGPQIETIGKILTDDLKGLYARAGLDVSRYFKGTKEIEMNKCSACDLRFFVPHCAGDDAFYEELQKFDWYYQSEKPEYGYSQRFVGGQDAVLEVGCGKGAFRSFLPASTEYTGLEFNDEAVRRARSSGLNVLKESIEDHAAAAANKYDVVCSFQVLEHVPQPEGFVRACVEAIRPGGRLIIAVPSEDSFLGVASNAHLNMPPHHALRWTDEALRNLAHREGLSVVDVWHEPVASFHEEWHKDTLAHHYFVMLGLNRGRLIGRTFVSKVLDRLFRIRLVRDYCAAQATTRFPQSKFGHTVVLVASKPAAH